MMREVVQNPATGVVSGSQCDEPDRPLVDLGASRRAPVVRLVVSRRPPIEPLVEDRSPLVAWTDETRSSRAGDST